MMPARRPSDLVGLAALALMAAVALGLIGRVPLLFDALAALRLHIAAAALLLALGALLAGRRRAALAAALAAGLGAGATPQLLASAARPPAGDPAAAAPVTLLFANVRKTNPDLAALAAALAAPGADVIATVETPAALLEAPALAPWPHRLAHITAGGFGPVLWSRTPFLAPDAPHRRADTHPHHAIARLPLPGGGPPLQIAALHLAGPLLERQDRQYDDFDRFWRVFAAPLVVVGDFNAAPWSAMTRRVAEISRTEVLGGVRPSWGGPLGLPIDQALVSPGLGVDAVETLAVPGSDHRALLLRLRVPRQARP